MRTLREISLPILAGVVVIMAALPAWAQNEPVIVVPGRPGVPVMMYGVDVSGAVIEGEFGLNRPGQVAPTVIMPYASQALFPVPGAYFPRSGQQPRTGRLEVIPPNRRGPQTGEPFFRAWGIESMPTPATEPVPHDPPTVIVAPPDRERRSEHRIRPHGEPKPTHPDHPQHGDPKPKDP